MSIHRNDVTSLQGRRAGGRGVVLHRTEVYCPHGGRVGQRGHRAEVSGPQGRRVGGRGVILHRGEVYCPHGGRVGQRGGQHLQS